MLPYKPIIVSVIYNRVESQKSTFQITRFVIVVIVSMAPFMSLRLRPSSESSSSFFLPADFFIFLREFFFPLPSNNLKKNK